jgi:hypothetical protein
MTERETLMTKREGHEFTRATETRKYARALAPEDSYGGDDIEPQRLKPRKPNYLRHG